MPEAGMIARAGHRIDLERPTSVREPGGGRIATYAAVAADVTAWVQDAGSEVVLDYKKRNLVVSKSIFVTQDLDIHEGDRVLFQGVRYTVNGVVNAAGLNRMWRIDCS